MERRAGEGFSGRDEAEDCQRQTLPTGDVAATTGVAG
jgi:hypothetical protein